MNVPESKKIWKELDSSKISCFLSCKRKFFFKYVWGLNSIRVSHDLHFGKCFHEAIAHIFEKQNLSDETINEAYDIFIRSYREDSDGYFNEYTDDEYRYKNPLKMKNYLKYYQKENKNFFNTFRVKHVEVAGSVQIKKEKRKDLPISINEIIFRQDAILEKDHQLNIPVIFGMEHKTTSRLLNPIYFDDISSSIQIGVYLYALTCLYEETSGIIINGNCFRRVLSLNEDAFLNERFYVIRTLEEQEIFLSSLLQIIEDIENNFKRMYEGKPCFYMNVNNCFQFFRKCSYKNICDNNIDPIKNPFPISEEFEIKHWRPLEQENIKEIIK